MARIPLALQLYSVRQDTAKDFRGTVKAVAEMGYEGVEFAGYGDLSATDIKQMLDENGLKCAGTHTQIPTIQGDELKKTIEFNQTFGNNFLVVPHVGEEYRGKDGFKKLAETLAEAADRAREYGAFIGYHNHDFEFKAFDDGVIPMRYLFQNTPENVTLQLDTGNALHGGMSATPLIEEFPGRSKTIHLKEYSATNPDAMVGKGDVDWQNVFKSCESVGGTQWYIVEVETYPMPPLECARQCLENLKQMGK